MDRVFNSYFCQKFTNLFYDHFISVCNNSQGFLFCSRDECRHFRKHPGWHSNCSGRCCLWGPRTWRELAEAGGMAARTARALPVSLFAVISALASVSSPYLLSGVDGPISELTFCYEKPKKLTNSHPDQGPCHLYLEAGHRDT